MAHSYWRLFYITLSGDNARKVAVGLEMRESIGGPNVAVGGTALAGSEGFSASAAFQPWTSNSAGTYWATTTPSNSLWWIGYNFSTPVEIEEITLTGVYQPTANPGTFTLEYSDDGINWSRKYFWNAVPPAWNVDGTDTRIFNSTNNVAETLISSQAGILATVRQSAQAEQVEQFTALTAYNVPAENLATTQAVIPYVYQRETVISVEQAQVLVAMRGRIANPRLRAWTFSLDGHDYYVLRLGDDITLVYDLYSEQWVDWQGGNFPFWRPNTGMNWNGAQALATDFGSNVVVGDDTYGLLWFLDPTQPYDEDPDYLSPVQERYFERITMGQVVVRGREVVPCYAAWLTTDMGQPAYPGAGVTLYTSDDGGKTFDDHGLVTVTPGEFSPELSWYSLGQIEAPGRLFKIVDDGAIVRIDGMEMNDPSDDG